MSLYHNSKHNNGFDKPVLPSALRQHWYGRVIPMEYNDGFFQRLFKRG